MRRSLRELGQSLCATAPFSGQEALEHESSGRQPAGHESGDGGGWTRHDFNEIAAGRGGAHESLAGIRDAGRARVGHDGDSFTAPQPIEHLTDARGFRVIVDDEQRRRAFDAGVREQPTGAARVLAADDIGSSQRFDGSGREVAHVADWSGNQNEGGRHPLISSWSPTFRFQ